MRTRYKVSLSQVRQFAQDLGRELRGGEVLALVGELGSGKTTFAQALGKALGVKQNILSPTFILLQEFPTTRKDKNRQTIIFLHLDLYRTQTFQEIKALGLTEAWGRPNIITAIEWADKIEQQLPKNTTYIYLSRDIA